MTEQEKRDYSALTNNDDKLVFLTELNQKHLRRISKNVAFFFWISVLGFIAYMLIINLMASKII